MARYFQLMAAGLLFVALIAAAIMRMSPESKLERPPESVAEPVPPSTVLSDNDVESGKVGRIPKSEQTLERVKELEKRVADKRQQEQAAEKTQSAREKLQIHSHIAWKEVIDTHRATFETLRRQSANTPDKSVPCTICEAKGVLDLCVVCDKKGKCPTCGGTGKDFGEICAPCEGSGKCFLCIGSGRMPCPFCQALPGEKEVITPLSPDPAADIPIN